MHKSRLGNIVIDCPTDDLASAAAFWSAALGLPMPREVDPASDFIQLVTPPGEVQVIVQRVRHAARAHLDIETDAIASEVARLAKLGASVVSHEAAWVVMQAPSVSTARIAAASRRARTSGDEPHASDRAGLSGKKNMSVEWEDCRWLTCC